MTPDLPGFSIGPGRRSFMPRPVPANHRRLIARCGKKGCKFCKATDVPTVEKETFQSFLTAQGWQRHSTGFVRVIDTAARARAMALTVCPEHGGNYIAADEVKGTFSEARICDPRCTGAIGKNCDCQCGGANHGCDWL